MQDILAFRQINAIVSSQDDKNATGIGLILGLKSALFQHKIHFGYFTCLHLVNGNGLHGLFAFSKYH